MDMDGKIAYARVGRRRSSWREGGVRLRSRCRSSSFLMPLFRRLRVKLCALCLRLRRCLRAARRGLHFAATSSGRRTAGGAAVCSRSELVDGGSCLRSNSFHAEAMIKECLEFIKRCSSAVAVEQTAAVMAV
ncbi:uncharacterized protein LOC121968080 [Zingiber officinale]|uniref:uncharacterized protein LOC121968080 n=1 Tax=Zingiber officinale TaxID=94328 RepID=UPI001C4A9BC1|nr:uncharacterized protein LOC121968080 [Zingiber officinale]